MGRKLLNRENKYPQPIKEEGNKVIKLRFVPQPKSFAQEMYLESLRNSPLTIGSGPAGSGKSFLAMAVAMERLLAGDVQKVVLTRPAVEAGQSLGFLPGDLDSKIAPYLKPLLDATEELVGPTMAKKLLDAGKIEFAPLSFMRGRTFRNSYVILDESQNATPQEMKLFVTRAGDYSTFVVNGDPSQCDLNFNKLGIEEHGLDWIIRKVRGKSRLINIVEFGNSDVQRSELVRELLIHLDSPDPKTKK
jgi:phosphate starvation-inducible PhoH-like protein